MRPVARVTLVLGTLAIGCGGMVRDRSDMGLAMKFDRQNQRAWLFRTAPTIPEPSRQVSATAVGPGGWRVASYTAEALCFAGTYMTNDKPVEPTLEGGVSLWSDFDDEERRVPATRNLTISVTGRRAGAAVCVVNNAQVVRDTAGNPIGTIDQPTQVPCTQYDADLEVCAAFPLAGAAGKYLALTIGNVRAVWHIR